MESDTEKGWRIDPVGDRCLMIEFGRRVDPAINRTVHAMADYLLEHPIAGVTDVVPAFTTVAVHYRPEAIEAGRTTAPREEQAPAGESPYRRLERAIETILAKGVASEPHPARTIEIPVCYGGEFGPDLEEVAETCGLTAQQVIELHGASDHMVYMLGFAPGFPYMGGLDERLAMPRRSTPRVRIPAGTVAIAREQSAVYTLETPGGWNLIGRTPLALFTPHASSPTLLRPGDHVRFVPISRAQFDAMREGGQ
jgi:inhibitor of KinA